MVFSFKTYNNCNDNENLAFVKHIILNSNAPNSNLKLNTLQSQSLKKQIKILESKERQLNKIENATHQISKRQEKFGHTFDLLSFNYKE